MTTRLHRFAFITLAAVALAANARAQETFRNKTINLIVSADAGTGYDLYARAIARHWPRHIPGAPAITVQNLVGAGGLTATNMLFNLAPKDGTTLGMIQSTVPFEPLFGNRQANFDARKFNWLGTPSQETATLMLWHGSPARTLEDARSKGLTLSATGGASTLAFYARVVAALYAIPVNLVAGYKSQSEIFLAMERGENEGSAGTFYSTLKANKPDWLRDGKLRLLLQFGGAPHPELKSVPFALDLLQGAEEREIMTIASAPLALGRPVLAPPGAPPQVVALLRQSLDKTFGDPAYLEDCARQAIDCQGPLSGAAMEAILEKSYTAPAGALQRLLALYGAGR